MAVLEVDPWDYRGDGDRVVLDMAGVAVNCKPGDMAMVVGRDLAAPITNAGKVVTCIRLLTEAERRKYKYFRSAEVWLIDRELTFHTLSGDVNALPICPDRHLLPINPQSDECATRETEVTP